MQYTDFINKRSGFLIALAGNPNVGKSTIFNNLTGMKQHTGNWTGKTVAAASGRYIHNNSAFIIADLPGTYSLMANSAEEEIARDFICFASPDVTTIVVDATCLERNLNLVLQILEVTEKVVVCVNLMDEAKKKKININLKELSLQLGVPVIGTVGHVKKGLTELVDTIDAVARGEIKTNKIKIDYSINIEKKIEAVYSLIEPYLEDCPNTRFIALRLLDSEDTFINALSDFLGFEILKKSGLTDIIKLSEADKNIIRDEIVSKIVERAEIITSLCVSYQDDKYNRTDRKIDKILTSKIIGIPIMALLLAFILWLTIAGANYPSQIISDFLFYIEDGFFNLLGYLNSPVWLQNVLVLGIYRTLAWVVSVMLPPMAIFFPLFTLLEDLGYLPRVAFNMDKYFKKAGAHGKQVLTMCMGFGCNACGVTGCRIIDSPRERLIAVLTNNFVPCNGRFPILIAITTMFFASTNLYIQSILPSFLLTGFIILGIFLTLFCSSILSKSLLKGIPSSFALELPPFRKPQIGKIIIRSVLDRTLFVLARAAVIAAPSGLVIFLMSNITIGDISILRYCSEFLDPFARLIGLDGVILMAFMLGFPANEIVVPIIIMSYLSEGSLMEIPDLSELKNLFTDNGWTLTTAVCTMLFSLLHFPCATTCITIKKETGSWKWTAIAFVMPTVLGIILCFITAGIMNIFI